MEEGTRLAALVQAAWVVFDRVAATAPAALRKGPRGGGRGRDQVIDHVLAAEVSYARKRGVTHRQPARDDGRAVAALHSDITAALATPSDGTPLGSTGWSPHYAARRIAWHVLDHAWEIEARGDP